MDLDKTGIYKIINLINGNCYYGSTTTTFNYRWKCHINSLKNNRHVNEHLQNAYNLYGIHNFEFSIVLLCSPEECIKYEQMYLDVYYDKNKNCYNILSIAGNTLGYKHKEETKDIISKKAKERALWPMLGKTHTEETKTKISLSNTGKIRSEKEKRVRSGNMMGEKNHFYGKTHTNETKEKISEVHKNKIPWNKGIERTDEEKMKISNTRIEKGLGRGSKNPNSKFTEQQIIFVKQLINSGIKNKQISLLTGVTINTIETIKSGKTWSHIKI